jgi:phosphomevalonate kinase
MQAQALPETAEIVMDTTGFYERGVKLGLGSSAAVCVALYGAFCELLRRSARFEEVAAIHHRLQGNKGSGIDVAAAWYGGLIRFERSPEPTAMAAPSVTPAALPEGLVTTFFWAGHPAATPAHLQRFAAWRERGRTDELAALTESSRRLFESSDCIGALRQYVGCLQDLDRAAQLSIYDAAHRELHRLAARCGVVYKPCGAGGGDIGAAFSYEVHAIERFTASARAAGFTPITLETARHGILVRR